MIHLSLLTLDKVQSKIISQLFCIGILAMLALQHSLFAQEYKKFAGQNYPVYGAPMAELQEKLFSYDGQDGWLTSYTLIQGDSLFVTNELRDSKKQLWKVEHCKVHIDSIIKQSIVMIWDSLPVNGRVQKVYSMRLAGKGSGGLYTMITQVGSITKGEVFTHFFRSIVVFFDKKDTAEQFFEALK